MGKYYTKNQIESITKNIEYEFFNENSKKIYDRMVDDLKFFAIGQDVIAFANRWAKAMQCFIKKGDSVAKAAELTKESCDYYGNTYQIDVLARNILYGTWKYGKELKEWYINKLKTDKPKSLIYDEKTF